MNDLRFRHNTQGCPDLICSSDHSLEAATLSFYYSVHKENLHEVGCNISELNDQSLTSLLFQ